MRLHEERDTLRKQVRDYQRVIEAILGGDIQWTGFKYKPALRTFDPPYEIRYGSVKRHASLDDASNLILVKHIRYKDVKQAPHKVISPSGYAESIRLVVDEWERRDLIAESGLVEEVE